MLKLPSAVRSTVLSEFIEEISAQALGASETLPFWRDCFGRAAPRFFLTEPGSDEHKRLWELL